MTDMEKLLAALAEVRDDVDFAGEDALVDDGLIDSFGLTQIIAALDEAFDIHIIKIGFQEAAFLRNCSDWIQPKVKMHFGIIYVVGLFFVTTLKDYCF